MKKSLLIAVAAVMVTLGANAQVARVAQKTMGYAYQNDFKLENVMTKEYQAPVSKKLTTRRAASTIDGDYILNADNFEADFTASTSFTVASQSGTITLDMYDGAPSFEYNVVLNDFSYAGAVVYGKYDAEKGIIEIPVQTIFTHDTYKEIVISGGYRKGTDNVGYGKEIYLIVNEDGSMDIDEDVEEEGDEATIGWVSFLPNYEDGGLWNYGFDIAVMKPNATLYYTTTGKSLGGNGSSWAKVTKRVAVEDYGEELVINGFLGLAPVSVTVNADGTCKMPFGQEMDEYDYEEYDNSYAYGRMRLVGCVIDGNSILRDYEKEFLNGFVSTDQTGAKSYDFYKVEYKDAWEDESGSHDAGYYYNDDDPNYCRYYCVATAAGPEGAYGMGWCCNTWLETDAPATGISNVKTTAKSNVKTYNLMGQEVNASAKGLIIRDGKKLINK